MNSNLEIERKFFIPSSEKLIEIISKLKPDTENRYYLYRKNGNEIRITHITKAGGTEIFTLDRMELQLTQNKSHSVRKKERVYISHDEFFQLQQQVSGNTKPIIREHYHISDTPKCELKVYKEKLEGLIRAEVEFDSIGESLRYTPLEWFGKEITDSSLGIDTLLPDLSTEEFKNALDQLNK